MSTAEKYFRRQKSRKLRYVITEPDGTEHQFRTLKEVDAFMDERAKEDAEVVVAAKDAIAELEAELAKVKAEAKKVPLT